MSYKKAAAIVMSAVMLAAVFPRGWQSIPGQR